MNELTPVEWLTKKLEERFMGLAPSWICDIISQTKEMEKQQAKKMYSEEELKSAFKTGFNIGYGSPASELDLKEQHCTKWFEQFKKK